MTAEFGGIIGLADCLHPVELPLRSALNEHLAEATGLSPQFLRTAVDALVRISEVLQENAALQGQIAALEGRVQAAMADSQTQAQQIATLEERLAHLQVGRHADRALVGHLIEQLARVVPLASETASTPPRAVLADEAVLLSSLPAATPDADDGSVAPVPQSVRAARPRQPDQAATASVAGGGNYVLVAEPFARFTDLGQFQTQLQRLAGVHNVRVRRFAQGILEMRLDYQGAASLAEALHALPCNVEAVEQEEPFRLRVRLRPPSE